ncbi:molybdopterin cofactor-binding domain-containing protein [Sphingopyxis sp. 22461]|uniref:xanthine dehydrogenase family protein molybdopterin-binding subunit n=1 Tax=Sphingopyxis sp. 22461 TaxID=3453923 RepID=UPI003F8358AD
MKDIILTRRGFVTGALVTAAGVSFTLSLAGCKDRKKLPDDSEPGVELLSWIVIHPDNSVTLRVPQTEIGQGVLTTIPQMLAEELELDWSTLKSEFYDPAVNAARENVYVWTAVLSSHSAQTLFEPTQRAGAQVRTMLIRAAASRLKVPEVELEAVKGSIRHKPSGKELSYASVAEAAAKMPVPDPKAVKLKEVGDRQLVGKPIPRRDVDAAIRGKIVYGIDFELPGMRFAAVRQSPTFGGKLRSVDKGSIKGMPGNPEVVKIKGAKVGYNAPVPEGEDPDIWAAPVTMDDAVAVVADSWWQAKTALDALAIEWDAGPHAKFSSQEYMKTLAKQARGDAPVVVEAGDARSALAKAVKTLSAEYSYPYMDPAPLEPINCSAYVDGGEVHLWTNSQFPDDAWHIAHSLCGVSPDKAHVHILPAGGGFGRRLQNDFVHQAVQIALACKGTPVKLLLTREECVRKSYYAPITAARFEAGLDGAGNVTVWTCSVASGTSAEQSYGETRFPFQPPNVRFAYKRNPDSPLPFGWMRGVGFTQHLWMNFGFLDELRLLTGRDVPEFYRSLLDPSYIPADLEDREIAVARVKNHLKLFDFAIEKGRWHAPKGRGRGRGLAVGDTSYYPSYPSSTKAAIVDVSFDEKAGLRVDHVFLAVDAGTVINPDIVHAQLEGGIAYALTTALHSEITVENGQVQQSNFHDYPILKLDQMPAVTIEILPSTEPPASIGEDAVPVTIAALVNAIADAGGPRLRSLPIAKILAN